MRGLRCVLRGATLVLFLALSTGAQRAERVADTPWVLVETFRVTDTLSGRAAALLRPALAQYLPSSRARVVTNAEVQGAMDAGIDSFGEAGSWTDVREVAKLLRADIVIDLAARSVANGVILATYRYRPATGIIDTLPEVRARSIGAAVDHLARRIAADTAFLSLRTR